MPDLITDATRFVLHEARCLDEGRIREWLALFAEDCHYWVPVNLEDYNPDEHVSLIYDDRIRLEDRVARIAGGLAHSQNPPSTTIHFVSNFEAAFSADPDGVVEVYTVQLIAETRRGRQSLLPARVYYVLRPDEDTGFAIVLKKVVLLSLDEPQANLSFLL